MGRVGGKGKVVLPVGGIMCWQWMLVVVLVCVGTLVKLVEVGPIYVVVGTCPGFCLRGVLNVDEHGLLGGPGLHVDFFMYNLNWLGSIGCPVVAL